MKTLKSERKKSIPAISHATKTTREIFREFWGFLNSKSILPLAIGLVIGDMIKQIVGVLVDGIIRPFLALFLAENSQFGAFNVEFHGQVFKFGDLISTLFQAFIIFAILYIIFAKMLKRRELLEGKKK